jgi:hypothetical protein
MCWCSNPAPPTWTVDFDERSGGRRIGTIYSYVYPTLDPLFASGARCATMPPHSTATCAGWCCAASMPWLIPRSPSAGGYAATTCAAPSSPWRKCRCPRTTCTCAISPFARETRLANPCAPPSALKDDGTVERILMRYRGTPTDAQGNARPADTRPLTRTTAAAAMRCQSAYAAPGIVSSAFTHDRTPAVCMHAEKTTCPRTPRDSH